MKKIFLTILFFVLFSNSVSAHSTIINSTPSDGETVKEQLSVIDMQFNTSIENMSTFTLKDVSGGEIPVNTSVNGDRLSGTVESPLQNGEYTVDWNIIGDDGHPITGSYSFSVALPESQISTPETSKPDEESAIIENKVPANDEESEAIENKASADSDNDAGSSNNFMTIGIVVLAAIVVITLFSMVRKSKK
ncbi:copper resistance CopC family protein [Paenisporosarcina indica]|uniref:copper resistance CopC family protein n=1 Tax=Paenisporosarcina indica TaxID=650093 RepID=UPI00094FFDE3|nr:copper resistance CopC family protein [Paenisporosarcina indica]